MNVMLRIQSSRAVRVCFAAALSEGKRRGARASSGKGEWGQLSIALQSFGNNYTWFELGLKLQFGRVQAGS